MGSNNTPALPTIIIPDIQEVETISIPLPRADVPYYTPMVVPPSDLRDQEAKPVKTEEKIEPPTLKIPFIKQPIPQPSTEVVVTALTTAVVAVSTTTLSQPIIEWIRKKVQKFLQDKIAKWRKNRKNQKDSSKDLKKE